ncbi:MAG: diguanylate cyclase, partial [Paracoccaceae bacterium]
MSDLPDLSLEDVIATFASLTGDAVSIGYRADGDFEAKILWVNDAQIDMFGYAAEETIGKYVSFFLDPETRDDLISILAPQFEAGERFVQGEGYALKKSGEKLWISLLIVATPSKYGRYSTAICRDITELKNREMAADRALEENRELLETARADRIRLVSAIDAINDHVVIWDKDLRLVRCNRQFGDIVLGRPGVPGEPLRSVLTDMMRNGAVTVQPGTEEQWLANMEEKFRNGYVFPKHQVLNGRDFRLSQFDAPNGDRVFVRTDITELLKQQSELEEKNRALEEARQEADARALRDELTGLGNRRQLAKAMSQLSAWRRESGGHIVAFHIDLDRFKQINDTMGHRAGDAVLVDVARRLERILNEKDTLVRIGGDEFLVLRPEPTGEDTRDAFANAVLDAVSSSMSFEGKEVRFGASIGIASTEVSAEENLATDSDIALYKAKSLGRRLACRFERADFDAMEEAKRTSDEILLAVENQEFEPYF